MKINNKLIVLALSFALALLTWFLLMFLANISTPFPSAERFFLLLGGSKGGYIQFFCYFAFFYGLIEIINAKSTIKDELDGFQLNLLPVEDQLVLTPSEVGDVKLNIIQLEKRGVAYKVANFIKKACTQYRNNNSVSETLNVLDLQINNDKEEVEGGLSMVRYLIGAIMSLGFIGTLIGLSNAIGNAHLAKTTEGMPILTSYLNVAFDTTMVALILGLILNYYYYNLLEHLDKFYAKSKSYIIDNLISRIYVQQ